MATPPFHYQHMFPLGPDKTEYYLLTKDYVSVSEFEDLTYNFVTDFEKFLYESGYQTNTVAKHIDVYKRQT